MKFLKILAYPLSILYGIIMHIRNKLFDWGILKSVTYNVPIICIGNLSVGGTGKTPHVEYLINLLKPEFKIAVLSRGYGRKTKGFILAEKSMDATTLGDEVLQYKNKYPDLIVAVCEKRTHGVDKLLQLFPDINVILLDDGFQHRYIKAGLNILLTDYANLYVNNFVLPSGQLREFISGAKRADIICISKSPKVFSPIVAKEYEEIIKPLPYQTLIFSFIKYEKILPLYKTKPLEKLEKTYAILMLTGIANPYPLEEYLKQHCTELYKLEYSDHHKFTTTDVKHIVKTFKNIYSKNKLIITTEKDAQRLDIKEFEIIFGDVPIHYVPIEILIHKKYKQDFDNKIYSYVRTNQ